MRIRGLEPRHGETAFAFLVLRFQRALNREALVAVIQKIAPMIPDADAFISELPDDLDQVMRIVGMPWLPGEDEDAAEEQRAVLANVNGIETAWFFQTGTGLPSVDDESDEDDSDREDEPDEDEGWSQKIEVEDVDDDDEEDTGEHAVIGSDEDDDDDDEEDVVWSHGPPAQVREVRFPVDGYPAILEEHDWEDFGIAFKLAGDWLPGESTVLLGFHALWLAPYGGRYRNAAVTIDSKHHAAHLWVDRFAVPITAAEQVHHLLWVLSKIDEVTPVLHARFAGATMAQKYGGLMGDTAEPFVLGGNPLLEIHDEGGERAVDAWLGAQTEWSKDELAQMLRELAIELVTSSDAEDVSTAVTPALEEVEQVEDEHGGDDDDDDEDDDEDEDDDDEDDDGEEEGDDDEDRGRQVTRFAGELLAARAAAGALDARVAARLRPLLEISEKYEHRRGAVVDVLGALRDRAAVPQMIQILRDTPIASSLDSIGKEDFLVKIANALGAIGDPSAIPALANVVRASGDYNDDPRAPAAEALASCLAAGPEPRDVDDSVLAALLLPIEQRNDGEANADLHLAYGRLASVLAPARRKVAHDRLAAITSRRTDATPALARKAALLLAHAGTPDRAALDELRPLVHDALTRLDYAHEYTVRNIRIGLRIGEALPELITPDDLAWLTRFTEPEIRARAHALLTKLGRPLVPAPVFDRASAKALAERTLVGLIADPHVVGRAALIAEAGNRRLASARGAIIAAADAAIARAREGGANLLDPDTAILAASVRALRTGPLEIEAIGLFDRMLRHGNHHVKWELLQEPPKDERLIGGMFHVLGEKWGWQEKTARAWLAEFQGSPAYEAERSRDEMN